MHSLPNHLSILTLILSLSLACGKKDASDDTSATDKLVIELSSNFPDFYELATETAPAVTSSSQLQIPLTALTQSPGKTSNPLGLAGFTTTFTTDSSAFVAAFSVDQNFIGQVLNDAGPNGPVKSIYVLLAQVQDTLDGINHMTVSDEPSEDTCREITVDSVTTPFFSTATNESFNSWVDDRKYTCSSYDDESVLLFGSAAIDDPPSGCDEDDAFEFYVLEGGSWTQENTEQVETRGDSVDGSGIKKFYYNGCTGALEIMYAQRTLYETGVEFSSRTELSGNAQDHTFTLRSNFVDTDVSYATHNTFIGHGVSKKESSDDDDAYFIMGYRSDNCGTSANSATCTLGSEKTFCVKNAGTGVDFAIETDGTKCASYTTTYASLDALLRSDLPTESFEVNEDDIGVE